MCISKFDDLHDSHLAATRNPQLRHELIVLSFGTVCKCGALAHHWSISGVNRTHTGASQPIIAHYPRAVIHTRELSNLLAATMQSAVAMLMLMSGSLYIGKRWI